MQHHWGCKSNKFVRTKFYAFELEKKDTTWSHQKLYFGQRWMRKKILANAEHFFSTWFHALIQLCKACKKLKYIFRKSPFHFHSLDVFCNPADACLYEPAIRNICKCIKTPTNMHQPFFVHPSPPLALCAVQFFVQLPSGLFFYFIRVLYFRINFHPAQPPTHQRPKTPLQLPTQFANVRN